MDINKLSLHLAKSLIRVKGVYKYTIDPGVKGTQKGAPYPGFIFPLSGSVEYKFNGTPYIVKPGVILHGRGNATIEQRIIGKEKWQYLLILYEIQDQPLHYHMEKLHFDIKVEQSAALFDLLNQIWITSKNPSALSAFGVETLFRQILEEVFVCVRNDAGYDSQELFETASEYIHVHYMEDIKVATLAGLSAVNENRLFYVFKKYSGMGPGDYLRNYRLNKAKELLVTTNIPIAPIAEQVGYLDPLYFSRIFKKKFGVSPNKFREM